MGEKAFICNNINNQDIIIKEFTYWDQANKYINKNFIKIKTNCHSVGYNIYKKR